MDANQQQSAQQELGCGGRGCESKEHHRFGAGEPSTSTTTDTKTNFATRSTAKQTIVEIWLQKTCKVYQ